VLQGFEGQVLLSLEDEMGPSEGNVPQALSES
jgi:hypothetical protein